MTATYREQSEIPWRVLWIGYLGNMPAEKAKAWEEIIARELPECNEAHFRAAIQRLCETWQGDNSPSIRVVKSEVKRCMYRARGIRVEVPYDIRRLEREIAAAPVHGLARWNLVCAAYDVVRDASEAQAYAFDLEKHAMRTGGLTIPYWAECPLRPSGCVVMTKAECELAVPSDSTVSAAIDDIVAHMESKPGDVELPF